MALIQGKNLVVKFGTGATSGATMDSVYCSTTCSLTINNEALNATCKDSGSWQGNIAGIRSWEVTTDGLYNPTASAGGFIDISDLILDDNNVAYVQFGQTGGSETIWSGATMLTTCSLTGDIEETSSWSASFAGNGALSKTTN